MRDAPNKLSAGHEAAVVFQKMEDEIQLLQRELGHAEQMSLFGVAAACVIHELNNVLSPVAHAADEALKGPGDSACTRAALQLAVDGIDRATRVTQSILSMITEHGRRDTGVADVGLAVRSALACLARPLDRDEIDVELQIEESCCVRMEQVLLEQVLLNLIINARRAMVPGGGRLTIATRAIAGDRLEISVADTGCGIPERVSNALAAGESGTIRGADGFGLGLAICRRIVLHSQGQIEIDSTPQRGTNVRIVIGISRMPS